jgi:hypothetical protein
MAWSVDRLGRSLQDLIGFLSEIHAAGVDLFLHQQGLDTTMPAGKALFQMMGVFAEFERSMGPQANAAWASQHLRPRRNAPRINRPLARPGAIEAGALLRGFRGRACSPRSLPFLCAHQMRGR